VVGLATGIQDKFSFKGVAMAALSGAVGGGLSGGNTPSKGLFSKLNMGGSIGGSELVGNVVRGALASTVTQGIGVATGLQEKFSFTGVASAGIAAGVGGFAEGALDRSGIGSALGRTGTDFAIGAASLLASAATRSVINGSSFGKNFMAGLPDVIGQVIGRAVVGAASGGGGGASGTAPSGGEAASSRTDPPVQQSGATITLNPSDIIVVTGNRFGGWNYDYGLTNGYSLTPFSSGNARGLSPWGARQARREALHDLARPIGPQSPSPSDGVPLSYADAGGIKGGLATGTDYTQWIVNNSGGGYDGMIAFLAGTPGYAQFSLTSDPLGYADRIISSGSLWQIENFVLPFLAYAANGSTHPGFYEATYSRVNAYVSGINAQEDADFAQSGIDFVKSYVEIGGMVLTPLAVLDSGVKYYDGEIGATEFALNILPFNRLAKFEHGFGRTANVIDLNTTRYSNSFDTVVLDGYEDVQGTIRAFAPAAERGLPGALTQIARNRVTFQGLEVRAVRDLSHLDDATLGAMAQKGFAGRLPNGESIVLHHNRQSPAGFIVELPASKHSIGNVNQHPFGNTPGSGLTVQQRADFDVWRGDYWRARAQAEIQRRASGQ
jgi:hypothetical protein